MPEFARMRTWTPFFCVGFPLRCSPTASLKRQRDQSSAWMRLPTIYVNTTECFFTLPKRRAFSDTRACAINLTLVARLWDCSALKLGEAWALSSCSALATRSQREHGDSLIRMSHPHLAFSRPYG